MWQQLCLPATHWRALRCLSLLNQHWEVAVGGGRATGASPLARLDHLTRLAVAGPSPDHFPAASTGFINVMSSWRLPALAVLEVHRCTYSYHPRGSVARLLQRFIDAQVGTPLVVCHKRLPSTRPHRAESPEKSWLQQHSTTGTHAFNSGAAGCSHRVAELRPSAP
jgi:hypothetical protein